jgi:hypothetical protein
MSRTLSHEVGHVIDMMATRASASGLKAELRNLYDVMNNPLSQKPGKKSYAQWGPEASKYEGEAVDAELMAEALRAYLVNPNYIKSVAPKVAAHLRKIVNRSPGLSRIIQLNEASAIPAQLSPDADGQSSGR